MLDNQEYFNQFILNSENIQTRLAEITSGFNMESITSLINLDIQVNHDNENIFRGFLVFEGNKIEYDRDFKHKIIPKSISSKKPTNKKASYIKITKGDVSIIIAGDEKQIRAKREDHTQIIKLIVELNPKTGMMNIETEKTGYVVEPLDEKQMEAFKIRGTQK